MKFIALHSDELDMVEIANCVEDEGSVYIAENIEEVYSMLKESGKSANYYKALFIYPANESKDAFELIKKIRKYEEGFEKRIHIIIFVDSERGVHLLKKFCTSNETFVYKKVVKRKLVEIVEGLGKI